jgi:hypothetical protein
LDCVIYFFRVGKDSVFGQIQIGYGLQVTRFIGLLGVSGLYLTFCS